MWEKRIKNPGNVETIVGIDVGYSGITSIIGEKDPGDVTCNNWHIIGAGYSPSVGIGRNGNIVRFEMASGCVNKSVRDAERSCDMNVNKAVVSIGGSLFENRIATGSVSLTLTNGKVTRKDIPRVVEMAMKNLGDLKDMVPVHAVPIAYTIDGVDGIYDPVGMEGVSLSAEIMFVTLPGMIVRNVVNCVEKCGLEVVGITASPVASAWGACEKEEIYSGVISVDIGAGSTSLAVFSEGVMVRAAGCDVGGSDITEAVAKKFKLSSETSEKVKKMVELAPEISTRESEIECSGILLPENLTVGDLSDTVNLGLRKIIETVENMLSGIPKSFVPSGMVLSGGVSSIDNIDEVFSEWFGVPVRLVKNSRSSQIPPYQDFMKCVTGKGILSYLSHCLEYPTNILSINPYSAKYSSSVSGFSFISGDKIGAENFLSVEKTELKERKVVKNSYGHMEKKNKQSFFLIKKDVIVDTLKRTVSELF